jgi:cytidylate kinase
MIITIDGPAGSGKSTAARKLAARLGLAYLDTGAMYRVVTLAALEDGVDLNDEQALTRLAATADFHLDCGPTHVRVTLRGHDVSEQIRSMRVAEHTRYIAASPGVRRVLVEKQRDLGRGLGSMVTEGRDQGTVAFPEADFKFYMDASVDQRAERRLHELIAEGEDVTLEQVRANVIARDESDAQRPVAPLRRPKDAIVIDTTRMSLNQVVELLLQRLSQAGVEVPADHGAEAVRPAP